MAHPGSPGKWPQYSFPDTDTAGSNALAHLPGCPDTPPIPPAVCKIWPADPHGR